MADRYIKHNQDDYTAVISELRPQGDAWPRDPDSPDMQVINGLAGPWGNEVSDQADKFLVIESFPPYSVDLLPEWETSFGLPDNCFVLPTTIDERHAILVHRMTLEGGPARSFFINEGEFYDYNVQITEHSPYMCGVSRVGDQTGIWNPGDPDYPRWELGAAEIRFVWTVHIPVINFPASDLQCVFNRYKPAHTSIYFNYPILFWHMYAYNISTQSPTLGSPVLTAH